MTTPLPPAAPVHGRQGGYMAKKCFTYTEYENMPNTYPPELKLDPSLFTQSIMASGNEFEAKIGKLLADGDAAGRIAFITEELDEDGQRTVDGKRAKEEATMAAYLDPSIDIVFNARIGGRFEELLSARLDRPVTDVDRISEPDLLEFGPVMPNGLRAVRFIDVKWHAVTSGTSKPKEFPTSELTNPTFPGPRGGLRDYVGSLHLEDWMQLSHYYRHGETLGIVDGDTSLWGAVIGRDERLVWCRIDGDMFMRFDPDLGKRRRHSALEIYDRQFAYGLQVIDNALARDIDPSIPRLHQPEWKSECADCPWRDVCKAELEAHGDGGHVTLLPGVTPDRARGLYELGVTSVGELAACQAAEPGEVQLIPNAFIYQARASYAHVVARAEGVTDVTIPSGDIEYDFDYEATTGDDGLVYMRGIRTRVRNGNGWDVSMDWDDDYSDTEAGEKQVFVNWWQRICAAITAANRAGDAIRFYHYSRFERVTDLRLAGKYEGDDGIPTRAAVENFYNSDLSVDLYDLLPALFYWPTISHSIKKLAQFTGFSWRGDKIGGDLSMVWYRDIISNPDPKVRADQLYRLREYNEDDVAAQAHLRDWVAAQTAGPGIPAVTALPVRPALAA